MSAPRISRCLCSLLALLVLHIVGTLAATRQPEICKSSNVTITTPEELAVFANCTNVVGDVYIRNVNTVELNIDHLEVIRGMVQVYLADSTIRFSAYNLTTIGGVFMITGNPGGSSNMQEISMPNFNSTPGLDFLWMPQLRDLAFPARIDNPQPAIRLTVANTGLESVGNLNLDYERIQHVTFRDNPNLKDIQLNLKNITVNLDIDGTGAQPAVSFPRLGYLNTANIHDVSSLGFENVEYLGGALGVYDSSNLTTLEMPNLKQIGTRTLSVLAIANNSALSNVSFPALEQITGGITADNNKRWQRLNGFPELKVVTDDISMQGVYTLVDFPMLYNLTGKFQVISAAGLSFGCKDLEKKNSNTSKPFTCDPSGANVFRAADKPLPGPDHSQEKGLTGPKITGIAIGCLACIVGPLILLRFIIGRKRKARLREKDVYSNNFNPIDWGSRSLPSSRAELPPHAIGERYELPAAKVRQELQGDLPLHELDDMVRYRKSSDYDLIQLPESPIERVSTGRGFESDVSRLDSEASSDDGYADSIVQSYGEMDPPDPPVPKSL
ncbi:hypothetical protein DRE_06979 [Drechslerella stenobrocha 248]|uniref:Receptor L-domain domain-containing protein n=1 Tax=Drechslerella stenobrocha 248 TaxID=1043628 RepID=W7HM32_9PEZI|nr:hypothetical protein DRE_06979 [Drechslerella stenobrocha 248]